MVDFGSGQGRSDFEPDGIAVVAKRRVAKLRRRFQKSENAGLGRKMPFMDGHDLAYPDQKRPETIHKKWRGQAHQKPDFQIAWIGNQ